MNFGFLGKGNASAAEPLREQIAAGACGFKLHEDWGTTPAAIDACLTVADEYDVQVAIHTDTLNEAGFVEDTIAAIAGRTIHTYHTEGAGGGHAPGHHHGSRRSRTCCRRSTNPTRPYTVNTHRRAPGHADGLPSPESAACPRTSRSPRAASAPETIAAEDILHDLGVDQHDLAATRRRWAASARWSCAPGRPRTR